MPTFFSDPGYTGDGFTDEHDDGWPANAHPDEVEHDRLRTTYPDMPPFGEDDEDFGSVDGLDDYDDYDDDGYYDADDDYPDDDSGYFDFYTEAEDIVEGETYGRYIGPGSDTLPESADDRGSELVDGRDFDPPIETFTCDGCGEIVTVWCSRCYCGTCCCKCDHSNDGDDGSAPKPDEPPPGRWGMPMAVLFLI